MIKWSIFSVLFLPLVAQAMWCEGHLISPGLIPAQVAAWCGPPIDKTASVEYRQVVSQHYSYPIHKITKLNTQFMITEAIPVEEWTYNLGPNHLMRRLLFKQGTLTHIDSLGYGYTP